MKPTIQKYIDRCVIDEYANKDYLNGFHLNVTDMSKHDQHNFLDLLMNQDDVLRELVLDRMQELINERLNAVEQEERDEVGLTLYRDSNGDTSLLRIIGY